MRRRGPHKAGWLHTAGRLQSRTRCSTRICLKGTASPWVNIRAAGNRARADILRKDRGEACGWNFEVAGFQSTILTAALTEVQARRWRSDAIGGGAGLAGQILTCMETAINKARQDLQPLRFERAQADLSSMAALDPRPVELKPGVRHGMGCRRAGCCFRS